MLRLILIVLLSAFLSSSSNILIKKGLRNSTAFSATAVSLTIGTIFLWLVSIITVPFNVFVNKGIIFFIIAGLFAPNLGRLFLYTGIERLGVSVTSLVETTSVLFSYFLAILFLNEKSTIIVIAVTILSIIGVLILSTTSTNLNHGRIINTQIKKKDFIYPILAALFYSTARIFRKMGVNIVDSSVGGATVASTSSWIFFLVILVFSKKKKQKIIIDKEGWFFFCTGAILAGLGQIFMFNSLQLGEVVMVIPLLTVAKPFFILLLTSLFLKDSERITYKIIIGASFIIIGAVLLQIFSNI